MNGEGFSRDHSRRGHELTVKAQKEALTPAEATEAAKIVAFHKEKQTSDEIRAAARRIVAETERKAAREKAQERLGAGFSFRDFEASKIFRTRPEEPETILYFREKRFLTKGVVGIIAAQGGTGKSGFALQLGVALAGAGELGPFTVPRKIQTLILAWEDSQDILGARLHDATGGNIPDGLYTVPVGGRMGPMMRMEGGNPVRSEYYDLVDALLEETPEVEVVILDPLSRCFGLEENRNDHATAFIDAMEHLSRKHGVNILLLHHANKSSGQAETLRADMLRGASALVDGARWVAGMRKMTDDDAKRYGIKNPRDHVEVGLLKTNYGAEMNQTVLFERESGTGRYVEKNPGADRIREIASELAGMIRDEPTRMSRRDLAGKSGGTAGKSAKKILEGLKEAFEGFSAKRDIPAAIDLALREGWIDEEAEQSGGRGAKKCALVFRSAPSNYGTTELRTLSGNTPLPGNKPLQNNDSLTETGNSGNESLSVRQSNDFSNFNSGKADPPKGGDGILSGIPSPIPESGAATTRAPESDTLPRGRNPEKGANPENPGIPETDQPAPESRKQEVCATCRALGADSHGRPVCFARLIFEGKPDRGKLIHRNQPACERWEAKPEPTGDTGAEDRAGKATA